MSTLTITITPCTEADLNQMLEQEGTDASLIAARLITRAVRQRSAYDIERLKAYAAANEAEELALADADPVHRAGLLAQESTA